MFKIQTRDAQPSFWFQWIEFDDSLRDNYISNNAMYVYIYIYNLCNFEGDDV